MSDVFVERRDGKIVGYSPHPIIGEEGQPIDPQEVMDAATVVAELDAARTPGGALGVAKRDKAAAIAAAYAAAIGAGLAHSGALYQIDAASQQRIAARALLARACIDGAEVWPVSFGWIATDNSRPTFTAAEFWAFAVAAQNRVTVLTLNARALKDEITAARTVADVEAIDASSGWE